MWVSIILAAVAAFFVGRSFGYKEGHKAGFKAGNEGGFSEDEKESIRQVLAVLTFGANKDEN